MGRIASLVSLLAFCLLADCTRYPLPAQFLAKRGIAPPDESRFVVCHGFACTFRTEVAFSEDEWAKVAAPFDSPATDPAGERRQIGRAVALFEQVVGSKIGTDSDIGGLTYIAAGNPTQLDCIDETTNTTTYLTLLQSRGLLRWHRIGQPAARGFFLDGRWHHETAVVVEQAGNAEFAIDSWVEDNGKPPLIVPLEQWQWTWGVASETTGG
jgi:hypothetical protein